MANGYDAPQLFFRSALDVGPGFPKTSGVVVFLGVVRGRS